VSNARRKLIRSLPRSPASRPGADLTVGSQPGLDTHDPPVHEALVPREQRHRRPLEEVHDEQVQQGGHPSVRANPRTEEIAVTYRTAAAIAVTRSAATIVRNERRNAGATAARGERPAWTSSFSRSKNTM
jgi:hypothetical protein